MSHSSMHTRATVASTRVQRRSSRRYGSFVQPNSAPHMKRRGANGMPAARRMPGAPPLRRGSGTMRRGDIHLIDLEPVVGSEADKRRPAVIVSNDGANGTATRLGRGVVTVVPVTSTVVRVFPFQVLLP